MARRKKIRKRRLKDLKRLIIVGAWCVLVVIILFFVLKAGVRNSLDKHRLESAKQLRDQLEKVKIPNDIDNMTISYTGFTIYYNSRYHIPNCTVYELTRQELEGEVNRVGSFETDSTVEGCARPWDYTLSGYERGHMVPAGDLKWSERAMMQSFKMTNVCPQVKALNEGGWTKLEEKVREWASRDSAVIVVTGPILTSGMKRIGGLRIAVPTRFFKIVLSPFGETVKAIGFIYPNRSSNRPLEDYAVPIDKIETLTGLDFFDALPNDLEKDIESQVSLNLWTR